MTAKHEVKMSTLESLELLKGIANRIFRTTTMSEEEKVMRCLIMAIDLENSQDIKETSKWYDSKIEGLEFLDTEEFIRVRCSSVHVNYKDYINEYINKEYSIQLIRTLCRNVQIDKCRYVYDNTMINILYKKVKNNVLKGVLEFMSKTN